MSLSDEKLFRFGQAARLVPSETGRGVNPATLHRWATRGLRGIYLEYLPVGGVDLTSQEALERFLSAVAEARRKPGRPPAPTLRRRSPKAKQKAVERAHRSLARKPADRLSAKLTWNETDHVG